MANVRGAFSLTLRDSGPVINGRFSPEQEELVLGALRNHRTARLRVRGVGEFGTHDRLLKRIERIDEVSVASANAESFVGSVIFQGASFRPLRHCC